MRLLVTSRTRARNRPNSEYYACQVAEAMGIPCVRYDLENWKGILASKCKLFTDIDTAFVPIGRIIRKSTLKSCLDYYKSLGDAFYEQFCSMLVFDSVIYNEDRHFGNFGLLRNNHTGKIISPAPTSITGYPCSTTPCPTISKTSRSMQRPVPIPTAYLMKRYARR